MGYSSGWPLLALCAGVACGGSGDDGGAPAAGCAGMSGTRANGGSSGTSGTSNPDHEVVLDAIGAACESECDQEFALDCALASSNTLTCQLSCASYTVSLGGFCLEEYEASISCSAAGGYDCVDGAPYQRSTCAVEQAALSGCVQHLGCKRYCQKVADLGCNDEPFDTCFESCQSADDSLPADCFHRTEAVASCQSTASTKCAGTGLDLPAACASSVLSVAGCIGDDSDDPCDGWCWAADRLGCGLDDCKTECAARKAPATCGSQWESLLDCVLFLDQGACDGDALVGNGLCESEQEAYQTCVAGDPGAP